MIIVLQIPKASHGGIPNPVMLPPLTCCRFSLLDSRIMPDDPHCPAAVMTKMLADQVLFAPLGLLMFFAVIKCLEGRPRDIPQTLRTRWVGGGCNWD